MDAMRLLLLAGIAALSAVARVPGSTIAAAQVAAPASDASTVQAAHNIAGQWQATLAGKRSLRLVLVVSQANSGWAAKLYSIDQSGQPYAASSVTLDGSNFRCAVDVMGANFQGTLSADGNSIDGIWVQGLDRKPMTLVRAAGKAWKIPALPKPPKLMDEAADVSIKKLTIKKNDAGATALHGFRLEGKNFNTYNTSVVDLISYAYEMQAKQVANVPDWIANQRYDIASTLDLKGEPTHQQLRVIVKKLLADRFQLSYHPDKQELSAYVLAVARGGHKLTPTQFDGPLPGMIFRAAPGGLSINVRNATMEDFAVYLQLEVLDRPVVDLTRLPGRYDLQFTYTPDDSQFGGHPPKLPPPTGPVEAAPGLVKALEQMLGLELSKQDVLVDVVVVDHVEQPPLK
jgi:uncharacterized protein (TIGR03435 family)